MNKDQGLPSPPLGALQGPNDVKHSSATPASAGGHLQENTDSSGETAVGGAAEVLFNRTELAKDALLPRLAPPGEEEADWFYEGICSTPRLVGRASAGLVPYRSIEAQKEAWTRDPGRSPWFVVEQKALTHIGAHAIRARWEAIDPIIKLAMSNLPWTSLDVVRLGPAEEPHAGRPVVVWVGVEHHDIPWPTVAEALRACRLVLDENNLDDVDVQVRVSQVFSLASRPSLLPISLGASQVVPNDALASQVVLSDALAPFSTAIGNPISPCAEPTLTGTLGIYISPSTAADKEEDGKDTSPVWAITCRHVGLPSSINKDNKPFRFSEDGMGYLHEFFMPSDKATASSIRNLRMLQEAALGLGQDSASFHQVNNAYEKVLAFQDREARIAGAVDFAPPIAAAAAQSPPIAWTKDYCLLKMDKDKFPVGAPITNVLDLRMRRPALSVELIEAQRAYQPGFNFPFDGLIPIRGRIPLSEIRHPPGPFENSMQDACILVMKQGATTGLTFGCPSEIMSTVRSCLPDGSTIETQEWAIPGTFDNKRDPFSKAGDSGAAIVGLDGRLGGFLTRGAGSDQGRSVDITYATPAVLVLEDIEKELGHPVVVL